MDKRSLVAQLPDRAGSGSRLGTWASAGADRWLARLGILVAVGLAAALFIAQTYLGFDEAYNLNLIKTLAQRGVYATQFGSSYRLFDPAVTSGPTVVLPMALVIHLAGAEIDAVRAALVGLYLLYSAIIYAATRAVFGDLVSAAFLLVLTSVPLVLSTGLSVQGDYPSIALALAALALLDSAARPGRARVSGLARLAASGAALGLAILAKDILALLALAVLVVAGWRAWRGRSAAELLLGAPAVVALGLALGWRGLQFLTMRLQFPDQYAQWRALLDASATILRTEVAWRPFAHLEAAWQTTTAFFGPYLVAMGAAAIFALLAGRALGPRPLASPARQVLGVAAIGWLGWFFVLSGPQAGQRHLLPGIIFAQLLALDVAGRLWRARPVGREPAPPGEHRPARLAPAVWLAALILLLVLGSRAVWMGVEWNREYAAAAATRRLGQERIAAWVRQHVPAGAMLSGWGWFVPWDIAFLADRTPSQAELGTHTLTGLTDWFVVSPEVRLTGNVDNRLRAFLGEQPPPLLSYDGYVIYRVGWRPGGPADTTPAPDHPGLAAWRSRPWIWQVNPANGRSQTAADPSGAGLAITVNAENAAPESVVRFGTTPLATTFGSPTLVTAVIPPDLLTGPGWYSVTLQTTAGESEPTSFVVDP